MITNEKSFRHITCRCSTLLKEQSTSFVQRGSGGFSKVCTGPKSKSHVASILSMGVGQSIPLGRWCRVRVYINDKAIGATMDSIWAASGWLVPELFMAGNVDAG